MTPKEKASDLVDKYCELLKFDYPINRSMKLCAIRCAIICVEQIIAELDELRKPEYTTFIIEYADPDVPGDPGKTMDGYEKLDYWKEVLEHLKLS